MKFKHFNTFFINLIIAIFYFFPSELSSQEYHDTIAWVWVNEEEFKATDGDIFSNKNELNALLSSNHVVYYKQALPFAKTPELRKIHEIRLSSQGNIDNLYQTLTNKYPNVYNRLSKFEKSDTIREVGQGYDPENFFWDNDEYDLWHLEKIQSQYAWNITTGDPDVTIAVIDREPDVRHSDLKNEIDPHYDPWTADEEDEDTLEYGCLSEGENPHGTAVASFASAETREEGEEQEGWLASIGFNTKIISYVTGSRQTVLKKALHASNVMDADVIVSCAGGSLRRTPKPEAGAELIVKEILDNETSIVMPAGNGKMGTSNPVDGPPWEPFYPFHPDYDDRIIIVTSTDEDDKHYYEEEGENRTHSHFGEVDICAPGYSVGEAAIQTDCKDEDELPHHSIYYPGSSGTSFASPIVAGVVALMRSINSSITPAQIKDIIKTTADPVNDADQYPGKVGAGRINAYQALVEVLGFEPEITGPSLICNSAMYALEIIENDDISVSWDWSPQYALSEVGSGCDEHALCVKSVQQSENVIITANISHPDWDEDIEISKKILRQLQDLSYKAPW